MTVKKASLDNLKPFTKGPDARRNMQGSKRIPLKEALELALGEVGLDEIVKKLCELARKGDLKAIDMFMDRYYGKVAQKLEHDIPEGIKVIFESHAGNRDPNS
jgi:hypothetical protein